MDADSTTFNAANVIFGDGSPVEDLIKFKS
jgi:hypothetical protein